jgi:hypothetical protein
MDLIASALPSLGNALLLVLQPQHMLHLFAGVLLGLSIGVLPGLGGIAGLSLVLPFMFGMDPISDLALMVGLVAVIPTSDTFSSVLLGIPGSSSSQATYKEVFEGKQDGIVLAYYFLYLFRKWKAHELDGSLEGRALWLVSPDSGFKGAKVRALPLPKFLL